MSTSVLPQLLEVDSELSAQATTLEAQLAALQEKRKGIQTVIAMFESSDTSTPKTAPASSRKKAKTAKATSKSAPAKSAEAKVTKSTKASKASKASTKTSTKTKTRKVKATRGRPAKAKAAKAQSTSATKKTTGKRSGRTANWQKYIQDSYSKAPLPDVIVGVLKAQPDNIFKIADVMNVVFKEDMPKTHFLKARNRVSNILSAGARDGDWYRGRGGTYSVSEKAIKTAS
ncbi:MAG: hypothetical protein AAF703_16830 [Cyanobacteria bacterium P01_D01_bin.105]